MTLDNRFRNVIFDREDFQIIEQLFEEVLRSRKFTEEEYDLWMRIREEKKKLV